jgi:hypothetical protein
MRTYQGWSLWHSHAGICICDIPLDARILIANCNLAPGVNKVR